MRRYTVDSESIIIEGLGELVPEITGYEASFNYGDPYPRTYEFSFELTYDSFFKAGYQAAGYAPAGDKAVACVPYWELRGKWGNPEELGKVITRWLSEEKPHPREWYERA